MTASERTKVILEFEQYLSTKYDFIKEAVYNKIMDTPRRFKADYCLDCKILIEINGGQWNGGRHNRGGKGYENDLNKLNIAQANGYKVYQFTYEMLQRREYLQFF
jgi:hypothetical protein